MSAARGERTATWLSSAAAVPSLFALATLIWGSTWLVITFQLGEVAPELSVAYRFALASALLFGWLRLRGDTVRLSPRDHALVAAQGAMMFGLNYVAVYRAEQHIASGLVAVVFSTVVFVTPVVMRIAFAVPLTARALVAASLGVGGVALLFLPQLSGDAGAGDTARGVGYALASTVMAAIGSALAVRNNRAGVGMLSGAAWGMAYGALCAAAVAVVIGARPSFDASVPYVLSLAYLAVFGSVVAFLAYLTLLRRVGAGPSSFIGVSTPVLAMLLSTLFEGYRWDAWAVAGIALAVAGNVLALTGRRDARGK